MTESSAPSQAQPTIWHGTEGDPVVVVLHDWNGRLPWADDFAERLAGEGFRVAVPDFYAGRATTDASQSRRLLRETVRTNNVFRWAGSMLLDAARIRRRAPSATPAGLTFSGEGIRTA